MSSELITLLFIMFVLKLKLKFMDVKAMNSVFQSEAHVYNHSVNLMQFSQRVKLRTEL